MVLNVLQYASGLVKTIPQSYFEKLNIGEEVECIMTDSEIIIRPVRQDTEFAENILKEDLIAKGLKEKI